MSDSVRPHRWQPTSLPGPWDSPGKNTGWVAISFSNAWKWKVKVKSLSRVQLFATPWTAAYQAPPSMGFSRQDYWSGVPLPSPLDKYKIQLSKGHLRYVSFHLHFFWVNNFANLSQFQSRISFTKYPIKFIWPIQRKLLTIFWRDLFRKA